MTSNRGSRSGRFVRAWCLALLASAPFFDRAFAAGPNHADFGSEPVSALARGIGDWVVATDDNRGEPFAIVDKVDSRVFVFDARGQIRGASAALLGMAKGDDSVPGIGDRKLSTIRPEERTTPAGRFAASVERSLHGDEILWVDYDNAIALHRVAAGVPSERRLQRLGSGTPNERRITFGCINVPVKFFEDTVLPAFRGSKGIVYVLPETRSLRDVFVAYGAAELTAEAQTTRR